MSVSIGELTGTLDLEDKFSSALELVVNKADKALKEVEGAFSTVALGASVAASTIALVTGAIVGLAEKGSHINDVAAGFDRLAGGAENANRILDAMMKGVAGTVDDLELMEIANKALATGAIKTAEQFGVVTAAARVLSREGFGPIEQQLSTIERALATGRTRQLQYMIGVIDLKGAEDKYAASIGATRDQLTASGKLHADQIAIFDRLNQKVSEAGDQQLSFAEKTKAARIAFGNWFDDLASAVAKSPQVNQALDAIGKAILDALGGSQQTAMELIVDGIDKFAGAVKAAAPYLQSALSGIRSLFSFLSDHADMIKALTVGVTAYAAAWGTLSLGGAVVTSVITGLKAIGTAASVLEAGSLLAIVAPIGAIALAVAGLATAVYLFYQRLGALQAANAKNGASLNGMTLAEANAKLDAMGKTPFPMSFNIKTGAAVGSSGQASDEVQNNSKKIAEATAASIAKTTQLQDDYFSLLNKRTGDSYLSQLNLLDKWYAGQVATLEKSKKYNKDYYEQLAALDAVYGEKSLALTKTIHDEIIALNEKTTLATESDLTKLSVLDTDNLTRIKAMITARTALNAASMVPGEVFASLERWISLNTDAKNLLSDLLRLQLKLIEHPLDPMAGIENVGLPNQPLSPDQKNAIANTDKWRKSLDDLANSFVQLSQVMGDSFDGLIKDLAIVIVSWNQAAKAAQAYRDAETKTQKATALLSGANAVISATGTGHKGSSIVGGAVTGAEVGSIFGPVGAGVGATVGALIGLFRSLGAAEKAINPQRQKYVDDAGGLQKLNEAAVAATGSLTLVENLLHAKNEKDYTKAIDDLNKALQLHVDILGKQKEIEDARLAIGGAQIDRANDVVATIRDQVDAFDDLQQQIDAAKKSGADFTDLQRRQKAAITATIGELDALGAIAVASFQAALASGMTFADAVLAAAPGLDTLKKAFDDLGIAAPDALMKTLLLEGQLVEKNPALVKGVGALGDSFKALALFGELNVDTFHDLTTTGLSMYTKLQGQVAAIGGGTKEALLPMQAYLHQAEQAAKDLNVPLDDQTAILIAQSKELGIWKDAGKTAADKQIEMFEKLTKSLEDLVAQLAVLTGLPPIHISSVYDPTTGTPPGGVVDVPPWKEGGAKKEAAGEVGYASGPMTFSTKGDEFFAFSGDHKGFGGFGGDNSDVVREIQLLRQMLMESEGDVVVKIGEAEVARANIRALGDSGELRTGHNNAMGVRGPS